MTKEKKDKIEKLKARGYDLWATIQACQRELSQVNAQIVQLQQKPEAVKE